MERGGGGAVYEVDTHPGIYYWDRGLAVAVAELVSGCREPDPEGAIAGRLRLSDTKRARLGEIGHRLGCKAMSEVATAAPAGHHP
jgi:hypothetical protein